MKKFLTLSLALMMALGLAACGSAPEKEEESQTFFDFDTYTIERKDAELLKDDYDVGCVMLPLIYSNYDPNESGHLDEYVSYTATQNGEEMSLGILGEYWADEPYFVHENESADFYIAFRLKQNEDRTAYDLSPIEVVLQDKGSDLSYTFTVDLSELDDSGVQLDSSETPEA